VEEDVAEWTEIGVLLSNVWDLDGLKGYCHAALDSFSFADRRLPGHADNLFV
jgi:hypothetical protein